MNFDQILKSQIYDLSYHFGLWTINKRSEECVTLLSDFLEMAYELNIKMKCLTPLLLGDIKNFLIPPRITLITIYRQAYQRYANPLIVDTLSFTKVF